MYRRPPQTCARPRACAHPGAPKITTLASDGPLSYRRNGSAPRRRGRGGNRSSVRLLQFGCSPATGAAYAFSRPRFLASRALRFNVARSGRADRRSKLAPSNAPARILCGLGAFTFFPSRIIWRRGASTRSVVGDGSQPSQCAPWATAHIPGPFVSACKNPRRTIALHALWRFQRWIRQRVLSGTDRSNLRSTP